MLKLILPLFLLNFETLLFKYLTCGVVKCVYWNSGAILFVCSYHSPVDSVLLCRNL